MAMTTVDHLHLLFLLGIVAGPQCPRVVTPVQSDGRATLRWMVVR